MAQIISIKVFVVCHLLGKKHTVRWNSLVWIPPDIHLWVHDLFGTSAQVSLSLRIWPSLRLYILPKYRKLPKYSATQVSLSSPKHAFVENWHFETQTHQTPHPANFTVLAVIWIIITEVFSLCRKILVTTAWQGYIEKYYYKISGKTNCERNWLVYCSNFFCTTFNDVVFTKQKPSKLWMFFFL